MSRLKLSPVGAVKLIIITTCTFIIANVIFLFLGCPQINMAGQLDDDYGRYNSLLLHCLFSTTSEYKQDGFSSVSSGNHVNVNNKGAKFISLATLAGPV